MAEDDRIIAYHFDDFVSFVYGTKFGTMYGKYNIVQFGTKKNCEVRYEVRYGIILSVRITIKRFVPNRTPALAWGELALKHKIYSRAWVLGEIIFRSTHTVTICFKTISRPPTKRFS